MKLLELYLSPIEHPTKFKAIVTQSPAGEGESESSLPFIDGASNNWRSTIIQMLEASSYRRESFSKEGELEWMVKARILTSDNATQPGRQERDRPSFHHDYLKNIGQALYNALFPQDSRVKALLQQSIRLAESESSKLLVRLKFEEDVVRKARLADYPWELLHDEGGFLCHRQVEFSRYIAYQGVPPHLLSTDKLNVLLVSSAASDREIHLKKLSDKERKAVRQGLEQAQERGDIILEELENPTFANLRTYLAEHSGEKAPHVLHFDGHGVFGKRCPKERCGAMNLDLGAEKCRTCNTKLVPPQGYLAFEDEYGEANYISAEELGTLLQQAALSDGSGQTGGVVLVVLSACQSAMATVGESVFNGAAQNLIAHRVPAVVAMQYSVGVSASTRFAEQFYRALGRKNSLSVAVSQGRAAMGVEGNQWYRPVLYLRWQDNEGGQLFASGQSSQSVLESYSHVKPVGDRADTLHQQLQAEEFLQDFGQSLFPELVEVEAREYRCFMRSRFHPQNYHLPNKVGKLDETTETHQTFPDIATLMKSEGGFKSDIQRTQKRVIAEIVKQYEQEIKGDKKDSLSWTDVKPGQTRIWKDVYQWLWECKFPRWQLDRQFWEPLKQKVALSDWIQIVPATEKNWELLELPKPEPLRVGEPLWISIQLPPDYCYLLLLNRGLTLRCFLCPSYIFAPEYRAIANRLRLPQRKSFWYLKKKMGMKLTLPGTEEYIAIALKEALDFDWLKPTEKEVVPHWTSDRLSQLWQWLNDNPHSWQGCYQDFQVEV